MELRIQGYKCRGKRVFNGARNTGIYSVGIEGFIMELGMIYIAYKSSNKCQILIAKFENDMN